MPANTFCFGQTGTVKEYRKMLDRTYGLDPLLYNGKKYYRNNLNAGGHPFWLREENFTGNIVLNGILYSNLQLKYELHKQIFILTYTDYNGALQSIILNNHSIDSVIIDKHVFIRNPSPDIDNVFIEQVYYDRYSAYISHTKEFFFQNVGVKTGYQYSEEIKKYFIITENKAYPFKNKKSFISIFPVQSKKQIKQYISSNHIKTKNMEVNQYVELAKFCNSIIQ